MFTAEEKEVAMKTYRPKIGNTEPICYRIVLNNAVCAKRIKVLDYGCGKDMVYLPQLEAQYGKGQVDVCDFSLPGTREKCLKNKYDLIIVSNVINVIPTEAGVIKLLEELQGLLAPDGSIILNYPASPRKAGLSTKKVAGLLEKYFWHVELVSKLIRKENLVYHIRQKPAKTEKRN